MKKDLLRIEGIMLGLAIGDALGSPTEFINLEKIKEQFGKDGIQELPDPALFTDDTQMTIAIAEALINSESHDVEDFMAILKEKFVEWLHSPQNNRGPGRTCLSGCRKMELGKPWKESGVPESMGCGTAMRVAPVGFMFQNNPEKLREIAHASGICTHGHRGADAACIGTAYIVKLLLDDCPFHSIIEEVIEFTNGISIEFTTAMERVQECMGWADDEAALDYLGEGWIGPEATALALFCFLRYPMDFKKTVIRGANTNGDSDSIACIAGAFSGAYLGIDAIPQEWIDRIERSKYIKILALQLRERREFELYKTETGNK